MLIKRAQARIRDEGGSAHARTDVENHPEMLELNQKIDELTKKAEEAGEEGDIDESKELLEQAEALRQKKAEKQAHLFLVMTATEGGGDPTELALRSNTQKLRVCDVCGAYLSQTDSDRRLADHFSGKTHQGYLLMRSTVEKLKEKFKNGPPPRDDDEIGDRRFPSGNGGYERRDYHGRGTDRREHRDDYRRDRG